MKKIPYIFILTLLSLVSFAVPVPESVEQATDYSCAIEKEGWPVLLLDPLPDDAYDICYKILSDYISYMYPGKNIVIGENVPMYIIPDYSQPRILVFIIAFEPNFPVTIQQVINFYKEQRSAQNELELYTENFKIGYPFSDIREDPIFIKLRNLYDMACRKTRVFDYVVFGYSEGTPKILHVGLANIFGMTELSHSEIPEISSGKFSFYSYGFAPPSFIKHLYISDTGVISHFIDAEHILDIIDFYEGKFYPVPERDPKSLNFFIDFVGAFNNIELGVELEYWPVTKVGEHDCFTAAHCMRIIQEMELFAGNIFHNLSCRKTQLYGIVLTT